jgi:3-hydroxyisobutyrate dehydrogenase-like beta-hydroxyacid dehydrogenase
MSTISTTASSELASEHARYGQGYVAAPVFGNPDAAKARQLFVIAAGAPTDVERRANFDGRADSMRRIYTQGRANDDNIDQVSSAMPSH